MITYFCKKTSESNKACISSMLDSTLPVFSSFLCNKNNDIYLPEKEKKDRPLQIERLAECGKSKNVSIILV